jgi:hypothetical protein
VTAPAQAAVPAPTSATFLPPISPVSLPTALEGGAFGAHRSALLRALSRGIGQNGLHVARRAADYTQQCGDPDAAIMDLVALAKDAMSQPVTRGDALFAIAVLGVEHGRALPELAFAPLLDATLRTMTMDHERRPGFEGLLRLAPRTAAYDALRVQLGLA